MEFLKSGGLKSSVTTVTVSPNQKPAISSREVRMLTTSEIELLRQDMKRANEILDRLLRSTNVSMNP
jgi:cyclopropane fatty-acyl-phospholipid synthase-like methyltransferase